MLSATQDAIELVSLLAESDDGFYAALAVWLRTQGLNVTFDPSLSWDARNERLRSSRSLLIALCGGLFVRRAASHDLEVLVTPNRSDEL